MKTRDLIGIVFAVAIAASAIILLYTQLAPAQKDTNVQVEIPNAVKVPLSDSNDADQLKALKQLNDYNKDIKLVPCDQASDPDCIGGTKQVF